MTGVPRAATARRLRRDLTETEQKRRGVLRDRRFAGWKFRRQYQGAGFIADFACPAARLIIELDGDPLLESSGLQ